MGATGAACAGYAGVTDSGLLLPGRARSRWAGLRWEERGKQELGQARLGRRRQHWALLSVPAFRGDRLLCHLSIHRYSGYVRVTGSAGPRRGPECVM